MSKDLNSANATRKNNFKYITSYQPNYHSTNSNNPPVRRKKRSKWRTLIVTTSVTVFVIITIVIIWDIHNFSRASESLFGTENAWEVLKTQPLKRSSNNRTNILLIGYSIDDPGHGGADLTDSILIVSLDNEHKSGYMLSVPRDLYVDIPMRGMARINEAYQVGEQTSFHEENYPTGGVGMLQKLVTEIFGIDIHYSMIVDYTSVKEIVNALGGIKVEIRSNDPRGIYDPNFPSEQGGPLKLTNGIHKIDGQTALRLTRARGSTYGSYGFAESDFDRTKNQQQIFLAIKNELNWTLVLDPRTNGKIFEAAGKNLKTNLTIHELIPFYRLLATIPNRNLRPISLSNIGHQTLLVEYVVPYSGARVLIPSSGMNNYSTIQNVVQELNN